MVNLQKIRIKQIIGIIHLLYTNRPNINIFKKLYNIVHVKAGNKIFYYRKYTELHLFGAFYTVSEMSHALITSGYAKTNLSTQLDQAVDLKQDCVPTHFRITDFTC